jgi:hypothetical protein
VGNGTVTQLDYIVKDGYSLPFMESFESGIGTRHWQVMNPDMGITWDTISVNGTVPGSKAIYMDFFSYTSLNRRDQLISPALNLSGYGSVILSFKHAYEQRVRKDSLIIRISDNCGVSWQRVWGMGPNGTPEVFVTHPSTDSAFYPQSAGDWCGGSYGTGCYTIDLSAWANQPNIKLMFESYNRFGNNLFLNDIQISGPVGENEIDAKSTRVSIYPNPSRGQFSLTLTCAEREVNLTVINLQGQTVYQEILLSKEGNISKQLDLSRFAKGVYFIRITGEKVTEMVKVVIQ